MNIFQLRGRGLTVFVSARCPGFGRLMASTLCVSSLTFSVHATGDTASSVLGIQSFSRTQTQTLEPAKSTTTATKRKPASVSLVNLNVHVGAQYVLEAGRSRGICSCRHLRMRNLLNLSCATNALMARRLIARFSRSSQRFARALKAHRSRPSVAAMCWYAPARMATNRAWLRTLKCCEAGVPGRNP